MTVFDVPLADLRRRTSIKWTRWEPDVLPMFVAEMDCRMPEPVIERLEQAMRDGDTGYPEQPIYQEAYARFAQWRWGWEPDLALTSTAGDVMQAMRYSLERATAPGDAVVINPPIYPPFRHIVTGTGRRIVEVPLVDDRLDLAGLERAFADGARAHLLCSPHNPNGTVHTREELVALAELAKHHDVTLIVDEIHAPLNGAEFTPFLALPAPGRVLVAASAAKAFNLAGIKAALLFASPDAEPMLRSLPPYVGEAMSHFGALSHATALDASRDFLLELVDEVRANKELFARLVGDKLGLEYRPSEGTYLAWLDCSFLGLAEPGRFFHEEARVRFNFGGDFAPETSQFVRVNLATSPEVVAEAVDRMARALTRVRS